MIRAMGVGRRAVIVQSGSISVGIAVGIAIGGTSLSLFNLIPEYDENR